MNFLKMLGGSSKKREGHVLGGSNDFPRPQKEPEMDKRGNYEVTFMIEDRTLGMAIVKDDIDGRPLVNGTTMGGPAHSKGIQRGDKVLSVDGNVVATFEALEIILPAIERPVTFQMERASPQEVKAFAMAAHDDEREARRHAMMKAAEERNKAWDKKLHGNRAQKYKSKEEEREKAQADMSRLDDATCAATQEIVNRVKEMEKINIVQLGYNPYEPQMSSTLAAKTAMEMAVPSNLGPTPPPPSSSTTSSSSSMTPPIPPAPSLGSAVDRMSAQSGGLPLGHRWGSSAGASSITSGGSNGLLSVPTPIRAPSPVSEDELQSVEAYQANEELDIALALLLDQDLAQWKLAVVTMVKMLGNVLQDPGNDKFRRIRISNPTFQSKVGQVTGACEVLQVAGFRFTLEGEEGYLVINQPPPLLPLATRIVHQRLAHCLDQTG